MKYLQIPELKQPASTLVLGCMRIDSLEEREIDRLVHRALELGINFFDHADVYGGGKCEALFSKVLGGSDDLREKMILQGKCGIRKCGGYLDGYYDFSKEYLLQAVDGILQRLKTDYLDVLLLHRPDALMEPEEVAEAFDRLEETGKVRAFGLSNANSMQLELLQRAVHQKLTLNQVQFGVGHTPLVDAGMAVDTMLPQGIDRSGYLLDYARLRGITLQAWSPLQHGFFEGVVVGDLDHYPKLNEVLCQVGERHGISAAAAAVAWILRHPAGIQTIVGTTKTERLEEYSAAADVTLSRAEWYEIYKAAGNPIP